MPEPKPPDKTFYLFDPKSAEWVRLSDGYVLGESRGNAKFAIELEKSHNHCELRLDASGVRLVDLGSPQGTRVNDETVPPGGERALKENDCLRINGRELYLVRGRVRPILEPARPKPEAKDGIEAPVRVPGGPGRYVPIHGVRGVSAGAGPGAGECAIAALRAAATTIRARWLTLASTWTEGWSELSFKLDFNLNWKRLLEPLLVALVMAAVIWWKMSSDRPGSRPAENPPAKPVASRQFPAPKAAPIEPKHVLQPPQFDEPAVVLAPKAIPKPPPVGAQSPPTARSQLAREKHEAAQSRPVASRAEPAPKPPRPVFEMIPVGQSADTPAIPPSDPMPAAAPARAPTRRAQRSVATEEREETQRFDRPTINVDGTSHRLDWCLTFGQSCGVQAADAYCKQQGFDQSVEIIWDPAIGSTAVIGEKGVLCPGTHPGHRCDGFNYIVCRRWVKSITESAPEMQ